MLLIAQALVGTLGRHRVIVDNEPTLSARNAITVYMGLGSVMAFLARVSSFIAVHFVAKR